MEHMAWKGRIKPGCKAEYQRRHAEIWPEMVKVLKEAGICNYSIFYCKDELFGYYECEKGVAYAEKVQAESPVVDRWNEYMKDILELEMDPVTGAQPKLEQVFRLDKQTKQRSEPCQRKNGKARFLFALLLCGNQVLRFIGHPVQGHGSNREICKGFGADDFCLQCLFL